MPDSDPRDERLWESGWDAHTLAQRRRLARLPLADKLRWLEEAQKLVGHLRGDRPREKSEDPPR